MELDPGRKEVFITSDPKKREGAEMDWVELYVDLNGRRTKVHLFVMRSKYSGKVHVRLIQSWFKCQIRLLIQDFGHKKTHTLMGYCSMISMRWCPERDLNPHAEALDPKSSVSANFTIRALNCEVYFYLI